MLLHVCLPALMPSCLALLPAYLPACDVCSTSFWRPRSRSCMPRCGCGGGTCWSVGWGLLSRGQGQGMMNGSRGCADVCQCARPATNSNVFCTPCSPKSLKGAGESARSGGKPRSTPSWPSSELVRCVRALSASLGYAASLPPRESSLTISSMDGYPPLQCATLCHVATLPGINKRLAPIGSTALACLARLLNKNGMHGNWLAWRVCACVFVPRLCAGWHAAHPGGAH